MPTSLISKNLACLVVYRHGTCVHVCMCVCGICVVSMCYTLGNVQSRRISSDSNFLGSFQVL